MKYIVFSAGGAAQPERQNAANRREVEEIPYGLRVSDDCTGLVASETERQIVIIALDMIVEDCPLSQIADELNRRGHTTREGMGWTPSALFTLLPRMIQVGPKVFRGEE